MSARFGKYSVVYRLGVGGMAEVFKCRLSGLGGFNKLVVVKRIRPELASDPAFVDMFLDEARIAANVAHPNVVQIFEIDQVEGVPYIAMEYVRGPTLALLNREQRKRGQPNRAVMARIMAGACAGLHCAHLATDERGAALHIIHRDVSPQNVIVSMDGVPKLLDFGIAKARGQLAQTTAGALKGKLKYMAPEQFLTGGEVTPLVDVFAAGVCLYEATTLTLPFDGETELGLMRAVASGRFKKPSELEPGFDPRLEELILWAMAPEPMSRCPSARALQQALEEYADREGCTQAHVASWLSGLFPDASIEATLHGAYLDVESVDILGTAESALHPVRASPFLPPPPPRRTQEMRAADALPPRRTHELRAVARKTLHEAVAPELDFDVDEVPPRESRAPVWGAVFAVALLAVFALLIALSRPKPIGSMYPAVSDAGVTVAAAVDAHRVERLFAAAHEALDEGRYVEAAELARRVLSERLDEPRATALLLEATERERERTSAAMLQAAEKMRPPPEKPKAAPPPPEPERPAPEKLRNNPPAPAPAHARAHGHSHETKLIVAARESLSAKEADLDPDPAAQPETPPVAGPPAAPAPAAAELKPLPPRPLAAPPPEPPPVPLECPDGARMVVHAPQHEVWCEIGGEREGPYLRLFPNGLKAVEGEFRHGKKHGRWLEYYEQGGERSRVEWRRGVQLW